MLVADCRLARPHTDGRTQQGTAGLTSQAADLRA